MDIEIVKNIVQEFAEKHGFIQDTDIYRVEKLIDFDAFMQGCNKMHGKIYICINEWRDRSEIEMGTIFINVDKDDEGYEEYYSIDKITLFRFDVANFSYKEALIDSIIEKCKKHKLL